MEINDLNLYKTKPFFRYMYTHVYTRKLDSYFYFYFIFSILFIRLIFYLLLLLSLLLLILLLIGHTTDGFVWNLTRPRSFCKGALAIPLFEREKKKKHHPFLKHFSAIRLYSLLSPHRGWSAHALHACSCVFARAVSWIDVASHCYCSSWRPSFFLSFFFSIIVLVFIFYVSLRREKSFYLFFSFLISRYGATGLHW